MVFLFKLINSFKGTRLNKKNPVQGQLLDHLLVGTMYADQQSAYLNSYETGLQKPLLNKLVETYWEINNKNEALEVLESLHSRNQDENLDVVYEAYSMKDNYAEHLKANLPKDEGVFNYYLDIYRTLKNVVPDLIGQDVIKNFSQIKKLKDSGWNYGRAAFLARCCYDLGYLSEVELKDYLAKSHQELKTYCTTWQEYTVSYIFGRAMWGGAHINGTIHAVKELLSQEKSPLSNRNFI